MTLNGWPWLFTATIHTISREITNLHSNFSLDG